MPRLIYEDVTSEELAYQLSKGWPSAGIMSSEGGVVFGGHSMQAENVTRYLSLLNGLWSGEQHVHSRRTTESFVVKDARLTVHIAVQEEVLRHFFEGTGGLARGTGFLARCLIACPESTIGTRVYKEPVQGWPKLSQFTRKTQELLRDAPQPEPKSGQIAFAKLRLSPDAKAAWAAYANATERRQAKGGDLEYFTDSGSKAADIVARMAALFHLYETGISGWIERKHIEWATYIVDWHLEQTMHLLTRVSLTPQRKNVIELDRWILERCDRTGADHVLAGSILQNGPYGVREKAARDVALDELISMNRVRRGTRDGRKVVEVNPELLHEN
jgi:putative DNA primase/helicase